MEDLKTFIERAKLDPSRSFSKPKDVLKRHDISIVDRIDILHRWEYDEREMSVAEEENMQGVNADQRNILDEILKCLLELQGDDDLSGSAPTKQAPTKQG